MWAAPFGQGRPGWPIGCSAMSMKYLGPELDIHTGAVDLIFPHHQNEIAQSEAETGKQFVKYWLHRGFLTIREAKMAKSAGNVTNLRGIAANALEAMVFRLFVLSSHYRSELLYSDETLKTHRANLKTFYEFRRAVEAAGVVMSGPTAEVGEMIAAARTGFKAGMNDDPHAPVASPALFDFMRGVNAHMAQAQLTDDAKRDLLAFLAEIDTVLGIHERGHADHLAARAPPPAPPRPHPASPTARPPNAQLTQRIDLVEDHHCGTVQIQQRQETGDHLSGVSAASDQNAKARLTFALQPAQ